MLSSAEAYITSIRSVFSLTVPSGSTVVPASIGPPETNTVGMLRRSAAMSMPGVILSQFEMQMSASAQCALTWYSTVSAMISRLGSEYSMPVWPMAMPSSTAIVLNSRGMPPACLTASETRRPTLFRCTCPGTNSSNELAMATIGLPKSLPSTPAAR